MNKKIVVMRRKKSKEDDKGKTLVVVMSSRKKAPRTYKMIVTPPHNKPRTKVAASAKYSTKKKLSEATEPSASKTKRRRLVRGPLQGNLSL